MSSCIQFKVQEIIRWLCLSVQALQRNSRLHIDPFIYHGNVFFACTLVLRTSRLLLRIIWTHALRNLFFRRCWKCFKIGLLNFSFGIICLQYLHVRTSLRVLRDLKEYKYVLTMKFSIPTWMDMNHTLKTEIIGSNPVGSKQSFCKGTTY